MTSESSASQFSQPPGGHGGQGGGLQRPPMSPEEAAQRMQFSMEEIAISRQCQSESFWQRALPISLVFGASVRLAGIWGILKNPTFGKVFAAGMVGFGIGKVSYISACEDKFLRQMPRSEISKMIRKRRGMTEPEFSHVPVSVFRYLFSLFLK